MVLAMWVMVAGVAGWFVGGIFVPACVLLLVVYPFRFLPPFYDYNL
jgi:hypothetical protein